MSEVVERVAYAWSVMDGKSDDYTSKRHGRFEGYNEDAKALLKYSGVMDEIETLQAKVTRLEAALTEIELLEKTAWSLRDADANFKRAGAVARKALEDTQ